MDKNNLYVIDVLLSDKQFESNIYNQFKRVSELNSVKDFKYIIESYGIERNIMDEIINIYVYKNEEEQIVQRIKEGSKVKIVILETNKEMILEFVSSVYEYKPGKTNDYNHGNLVEESKGMLENKTLPNFLKNQFTLNTEIGRLIEGKKQGDTVKRHNKDGVLETIKIVEVNNQGVL